MAKIIMGIHGLANKPDHKTLDQWWKQSIELGLRRNLNMKNPAIKFEGVYWAGQMYEKPIANKDNSEPYDEPKGNKPFPRREEGIWDELGAGVLDVAGDILDGFKKYVGMDSPAELLMAKKLKDLYAYYEFMMVRNTLRDRLRNEILNHEKDEVLLIAHSMGSIIAYDVLRGLEGDRTKLTIAHLVTIGSPLGLPHVRNKIRLEHGEVRTPSNVNAWTNLSDRMDPVCFDVFLAGDFGPNRKGVTVRDDLVSNTYRSPKTKSSNHHKSYGYLRTPEMSDVVAKFV